MAAPKHILDKIREAQEQQFKELDLSDQILIEIPEEVFELEQLESLNLRNCYLKRIPEAILRLKNLKSLNLIGNRLLEIPELIVRLPKLTFLEFSWKPSQEMPSWVDDIQELGINLSVNRLETLPESITQLTNLTSLDLRDNPLEKPPLEIANRGIEAIRDYFRQIKQEGLDYIYEAKLLIVGEGGAGKTTLAKKIKDPNYQLQDEESTKGIEVIKWQFPMNNGRDFRVNIWDFGGQEIYHATHQFFLTKRSLYTLVADTRKEDTDFYYWLNIVELLSDNSPLLIIKNEKKDRKREINDRALRGEFTNLKETLATNLKTNRGLDNILTKVKHYISNLDHIGSALPKTWKQVREALEKDTRNHITLDEYLKICEQNGFTLLKDKLQLSGYLHDLGVCLHFQDEEDSLLYRTVILKPEWGTDAVYKVLDNEQVIENQGSFNRDDLKNIWEEEKYAPMRGELLELMKKFQLCYEIPECKNTFIAPQLLAENQPEYKWNESSNLILRYAYPAFMPKGIVTRFIVAMHEYIDKQNFVWRSGVILMKDNTKAEIIENYGLREIKIRVVGSNKRDLMTVVTYEIDKINTSYERLKYQKLIPCNCSTCKNSQNPHFYNFEKLQEWRVNGRQTTQCDNKPYETVNISSLIDDVINQSKIPEQENIKHGNYTIKAGHIEHITIQQPTNGMTNQPPPENSKPKVKLPSAWRNGLFYLFVFAVVFNSVAIFAGELPLYSLIVVVLATMFLISLIGVFQLRQDDRLSDESTVELIKMVFEQLPLFSDLMKIIKSD